MDINFTTEKGRFNYRVCAVMIDEGRLLVMRDSDISHYYLPGGRVKMGERAEDALKRELREELSIDATIVRPLWINQSFFSIDDSTERIHELCIYFLVDVTDTTLLARGECFSTQEAHRTHSYRWMDFGQLKDEYLYPIFIKTDIFHLPTTPIFQTEVNNKKEL